MPLRLNLGCGRDLRPASDGWINIDSSALYPDHKPDLVHDLHDGLPMYETSSVDEILANDIIEHIQPWRLSKIALFNELHRVLKPGGILNIRTPRPDGPGWYQDPTHYTVYGPESWDYFSGEHGPEMMIGYGITCQFVEDFLQYSDHLNMEVTLRAIKPTIQEEYLRQRGEFFPVESRK